MLPKYDCATCGTRDKQTRGCIKKVRQPKTPEGDDPINYCYKVFSRDNPALYSDLLLLHANWSKGIMPNAGGVYDQPALIPEALMAVEIGISLGKSALQEEAVSKTPAKRGGAGRR